MTSSSNSDDESITAINVTPLVDITLVLLVVLMITASYMMARTIPVELPNAHTGESRDATLAISIDRAGTVYVDAELVTDTQLRARIERAGSDARAIIAADAETSHRHVIHVIDVLRQEHLNKFAIDVAHDDAVR